MFIKNIIDPSFWIYYITLPFTEIWFLFLLQHTWRGSDTVNTWENIFASVVIEMKLTIFPDISLGSGTSSSTQCRISHGVYYQGFLMSHILIYPQLIQCCSRKWVCWTQFMISDSSYCICVNFSGFVNIPKGKLQSPKCSAFLFFCSFTDHCTQFNVLQNNEGFIRKTLKYVKAHFRINGYV